MLNERVGAACKIGLAFISLNKKIERMHGISLVQWYFLLAVKDRPGCQAKDLATAVGVHPSTLTQTMKRLEKKKYISVMNHPKDSRKKRISLSFEGFNQVKKMEGLSQQTEELIGDFLAKVRNQ